LLHDDKSNKIIIFNARFLMIIHFFFSVELSDFFYVEKQTKKLDFLNSSIIFL